MPSGLIGFLSFFSFFFFFLCWKDSAGPIVCYWPNRLRPETLPWLSQKNQVPLVAACLESALSSCYSLPYPGLSHPGLQSNLVVTRLHPHCWASGFFYLIGFPPFPPRESAAWRQRLRFNTPASQTLSWFWVCWDNTFYQLAVKEYHPVFLRMFMQPGHLCMKAFTRKSHAGPHLLCHSAKEYTPRRLF